jgi:hypothetical protein
MPSTNFISSEPSHSGPISRPTLLLVGTVTVLAAGYALGYLLRPGGVWAQDVHSFQVSGTIGQGSLVYFIAAGLALLLLVTMLKSSNIMLWRRNPFAGRSEKPIGQFVQEAKGLRISLRVAREAYYLLQHHYPKPMCIDFNDDLRRDLRMTAGNVVSLRSGLLGRTDRSEQGGYDYGKITTVRELLEQIEAAPKNGVDRAKMKQRVADLPFSARPVVENLEFTEASSLADPDFLRRAHFKWLRRRTADYKGFRSRASDNNSGQQHMGPFRRATELSRRLAIKQEAGRLAKIAEQKRVEEEVQHDSWMPPSAGQDNSGHDISHHGY